MTVTSQPGTLEGEPECAGATEANMWTVVTSLGQRVDGITHEHVALSTVHSMGVTTLLAPYRYLVTDNHGHRFHAEIHRFRA
jgi:hypothetical protein